MRDVPKSEAPVEVDLEMRSPRHAIMLKKITPTVPSQK
jgi:hypothetical protein